MSVVVLGGAGFIGERLVAALVGRGQRVTVIDNLYARASFIDWRLPIYERRLEQLGEQAEIVEADVRDIDQMARVISAVKPETVFYLSALTASQAAAAPETARETQVDALRAILPMLDAALSDYRFVHASSSFVYGDFVETPADERHPCNPIELYGRLKLEAEQIIRAAEFRRGGWMILRPSAVYGVGDSRVGNLGPIVEAVAANRAALCEVDGTLCDFTYVDDVASAFAAAYERFEHGLTLNVTPGRSASAIDFCELLMSLDPAAEIRFKRWEGVTPKRGAIDSRRAADLIGWTAAHTLESGIAATLSEARAIFHPNGVAST